MSQITTDMFHLSQTHPSYLITGFVTQWVSLVEQELLALPGHQSSPPVLCVLCPFPSVHCVVCPSIYEFRLPPLWHLQTLLASHLSSSCTRFFFKFQPIITLLYRSRVSDCCLTPIQTFFSCIMARTS